MTATVSEYTSPRIEKYIRSLHPNLPYHNGNHHEIVRQRAHKLVQLVRELGMSVDDEVVDHAALLHDILVPLDQSVVYVHGCNGYQPCQSKEDVARYFSGCVLRKFGYDDPFIDKVCGSIAATNPMGDLTPVENQILRAADLGGLMLPYDNFNTDWEAIREESAILQGKDEIDPITFARGTIAYLCLFLMWRIELTSHYFDESGASTFHVKALGNIIRKLHDVWGEGNLHVVGEFGCGRMPAPVDMPELFDANTLYLGTDIGVRDMHFAHEQLKATKKLSPQRYPMCMLIPGENKGVSFPTGCLDTMVVRNGLKDIRWTGFPFIQLVRPLKRGGQMIVVETYQADGASRTGYNEPLNRYLVQTQMEGLGLTHIATTKVDAGGWRMEFHKY